MGRENLRGIGRTGENVWGRAWRRQKLRRAHEGTVEGSSTARQDAACVFGFEVTVVIGRTGTKAGCRWLEGHDEATFQSICGYLKGQLGDG